MSPKDSNDTKSRILKVAMELFASKGYSGTSIRDIAKAAEVNLAAVNYHFSNKANLYDQVFEHNFTWIAQNIESIGSDENINTEDFTIRVLDFFLDNSHYLLNTFKIFLDENVDTVSKVDDDHPFGPPEEAAFTKKILLDLSDDLPPAGTQWAVKCIFTHIVHLGVMLNTKLMRERCKTTKELSPDMIRLSVRHMVRATLEYLDRNRQIFQA